MKVLLVDDERLYRQELARLLTELGHTVEVRSGSRELTSDRTGLDFDLFVIDLMLREDSGGSILAERLMRESPSVPLVVISGLPHYQFVEVEGHRHLQFLSKPFGRTEFIQAVSSALQAVEGPGRRSTGPREGESVGG